jgi:hypothetical protein
VIGGSFKLRLNGIAQILVLRLTRCCGKFEVRE